jgi:pimeloyl-ACP methyl ester carboxylesterase
MSHRSVVQSLLTALLLFAPAAPALPQAPPADFATGTVRANGLTFAYIEAGRGPLVLALHGFPDHPRTFRHQMRALAAAGYRVVAPFERGYAPTTVPPDGAYRSAALVADALALIDALGGGKPVILLGHDWGAVAAQGAAAVAPRRVAKLITIAIPSGEAFGRALVRNPAQQRRSWYMYFFATPFAEEAVRQDGFAFVDRLWRDWSPGWRYPAAELDSVKAVLRRPGALHGVLNYYRENLGLSRAPAATVPDSVQERMDHKIAVPTLYLLGADDGCIGAEVSEGVEAHFTGPFAKRVVPGAGHFVHQERPDEVNRMILAFLGPVR